MTKNIRQSVEVVAATELLTAVVRGKLEEHEIPAFLGQASGNVVQQVPEQGAQFSGAPWESRLDSPEMPYPRTRFSFPSTKA